MYELVNSHYNFLVNQFFRENRFLIKYPESTWQEWEGKPSMDQVVEHSDGACYLGYIFRDSQVNFIAFDLDVKNPDQRNTLKSRLDAIYALLGPPSLISSSPSGGLHSYYLLNDSYHHQVISYVVCQRINLSRGNIELFPSNNGLRLLGGKDMHLLNEKLEVIADDPEEIFSKITYQWRFGIRHNLFSWLPYWPDGKKPVKKYQPNKNNRMLFNELVGKGLTELSTRHAMFLKLSHYLQTHEDFDAATTATFLENWIHDKHNGCSNDYPRDPGFVRKDIAGVVKSYNPAKAVVVPSFNRKLLTSKNIDDISQLAATIDHQLGVKEGSALPFLLDLFSFCKFKHKHFEVDIPKNVFQSCENGSRTRYVKYKDKLKELGVLKTIRNYSPENNKSYRYLITGNFIS